MMMRWVSLSLFVGVLLFSGSGCSLYYGRMPACPVAELKKIAVLPVMGAPSGQAYRFGRIFGSELVQCPGIEAVVWPENSMALLSDEKALGQAQVQGILCIELIDFDMHAPPRATLRCHLLMNHQTAANADFVKYISSRGSNPMGGKMQSPEIISVEKSFNAENHKTSEKIWCYALRNEDNICGISSENRVIKVGSSFFRFISTQIIEDIFAKLKEKQLNDRSKECKRELVHS